jgi:Flp pilus assembly protein TadD
MSQQQDAVVADLQRVSALCDLRRFDEASARLAAIVAANPQSPQAWCLKSRVAIGTGEYDAALHAAKTAISLGPDAEWPHRLASIALARAGQRPEAAWHAREAVRVAPHEWRAFTNLARMLAPAAADRAQAREAAQRALELAPHEVEAHMASGAVALADGRRADAEAAFRAALAIDPQCSAAHNELARLQLPRTRFGDPGGLAQAASGFASAVRADPRAEISRRNLDLVLRAFLARVAYFVFLAAFVVAEVTSGSSPATVRTLAAVAVVVPALFVARFLSRLPPILREHLLALVRHTWELSLAVAAQLLAVCLLALDAVIASTHAGLALGALGLSALGRLVLYVHGNRRAAVDAPSSTHHLGSGVSTPMLWFFAAALIAAAGIFADAAAHATLSASGAYAMSAGCAIAAGGIVAYIVRRRGRSPD